MKFALHFVKFDRQTIHAWRLQKWPQKHHVGPVDVYREKKMSDRRVTMVLSEELLEAIQKLATANNYSIATVLRNAISHELFLRDAVENGSKILIKSPDKDIREVIL